MDGLKDRCVEERTTNSFCSFNSSFQPLPLMAFPCYPLTPSDSWYYLADEDIRTTNFRKGTEELLDPLSFHHGRLWSGDRIVVPKNRVTEILRRCHDVATSGHWGISRTCALVRRKYVLAHLKDCVRKYVRSCDLCQRFKADHHLPRGYIENLEIPVQRWQSISLDWINRWFFHFFKIIRSGNTVK